MAAPGPLVTAPQASARLPPPSESSLGGLSGVPTADRPSGGGAASRPLAAPALTCASEGGGGEKGVSLTSAAAATLPSPRLTPLLVSSLGGLSDTQATAGLLEGDAASPPLAALALSGPSNESSDGPPPSNEARLLTSGDPLDNSCEEYHACESGQSTQVSRGSISGLATFSDGVRMAEDPIRVKRYSQYLHTTPPLVSPATSAVGNVDGSVSLLGGDGGSPTSGAESMHSPVASSPTPLPPLPRPLSPPNAAAAAPATAAAATAAALEDGSLRRSLRSSLKPRPFSITASSKDVLAPKGPKSASRGTAPLIVQGAWERGMSDDPSFRDGKLVELRTTEARARSQRADRFGAGRDETLAREKRARAGSVPPPGRRSRAIRTTVVMEAILPAPLPRPPRSGSAPVRGEHHDAAFELPESPAAANAGDEGAVGLPPPLDG